MDYQSILTNVGDRVSGVFSEILTFLNNQTPVKIISIIILLAFGYFALSIAKPIVKWTIIVLIVFLVISTGYTLFN
jgi:hypothetical protein